MRYVFQAYSVPALLPVVLLLGCVAALPELQLPLPSLTGDAGVPLRVMAALAECFAVGLAIFAGWRDTNRAAVRPTRAHLALVVVLMWSSASLVDLVITVFNTAHSAGFAAVLSWLLGMQLIAGVVGTWQYAAVMPTVYVLLCALLGRIDSAVQPWAWPLTDTRPESILVGASLLALGLLLVLLKPTREVIPS